MTDHEKEAAATEAAKMDYNEPYLTSLRCQANHAAGNIEALPDAEFRKMLTIRNRVNELHEAASALLRDRDSLRERVKVLEADLSAWHRRAGFLRSCALSGEIPTNEAEERAAHAAAAKEGKHEGE